MHRCRCSCCCRRYHYSSYYSAHASSSSSPSSSTTSTSSSPTVRSSVGFSPSTTSSCRSSTSSTSVEQPSPPSPAPTPPLLLVLCVVLALLSVAAASAAAAADDDAASPPAAAALPVHKYSTRVVRTKYGPLRGVVLRAHPPVEAFLGVPYASPPLGALRYMPPVTPSMWRTTRLADAFAPVCPQRAPDIGNRTEALLEFPRGRLLYLEKLLPLLANQSEDCLYLNVYVPRGAPAEPSGPLPAVVYVHGESFEWNSGNPYDGSVLAGYGRVIVVTLNFRLGILGFLKTGARGSAQGNFGLMDLVAGLHWLRENLPAFGGDPERVTLLGHGTGAALANFIAVSPVAKELLHRVVLLSGSALSPWALQRDPLFVKRKVAEQTGCHGDLLDDDLAPCLRAKPLADLLAVRIDAPRFLPGFAPFVDGTVLAPPPSGPRPPPPSASAAAAASAADPLLLGTPGAASAAAAGAELADFPERDLLFGLTTTESYLDLSAQDLEYGLNESRRDRILRTYVRNAYFFHLNEIFSTLKNEYTDWERPVQNPLSVRDSTLEVLSDGHTAAPLVRVGYLHTLRGGRTYFLHFQHQSGERDFPQRQGSVRGEDVPYVLGLPLVNGQPFFPHNYTRQDAAVSRLLIHYLANFARKGDPNSTPSGPHRAAAAAAAAEAEAEASAGAAEPVQPLPAPFWDTYDSINQLYMELGAKAEMKNHYRGHKMSLWLNLIPQLHRPGGDDLSMRHHHFQEEGAQYYEGLVRQQSLSRPPASSAGFYPGASATTASPSTPTTAAGAAAEGGGGGAAGAAGAPADAASTTTECPPNATAGGSGGGGAMSGGGGGGGGGGSPNANARPAAGKDAHNNNLLRKLASSHYQSYTTALTVTIAVGCFLLLLNILIFAGIYHQRDRGGGGGAGGGAGGAAGGSGFGSKKKDELAEAGSCSSSSGDGHHFEAKHALLVDHLPLSASQQHLHRGGGTVELPIQEFKASPTAALKRQLLQAQQQAQQEQHQQQQQQQQQQFVNPGPSPRGSPPPTRLTSPSIPDPPPPPKHQPPTLCNQAGASGGILRQQGCPQTPGTMKKRVQIQEISV